MPLNNTKPLVSIGAATGSRNVRRIHLVRHMDVTHTSSVPRDATVIVIPYSDGRAEHLKTWLDVVVPRLHDGGGPFTIVLARQVGRRLPFNRGLVLVAAVLAVGPLDPGQRVVFWDVDLVPSADICAAIVDLEPWGRHKVVNFSQPGFGRYSDDQHTFAGGILGMTVDTLVRSGGPPITIFGWGSEDDAFSHRLRSRRGADVDYIAHADEPDLGIHDLEVQDLEDFPTARDKIDHLRQHDAIAPDRRNLRMADERCLEQGKSNLIYCKELLTKGTISVAVRQEAKDYYVVDVAPVTMQTPKPSHRGGLKRPLSGQRPPPRRDRPSSGPSRPSFCPWTAGAG